MIELLDYPRAINQLCALERRVGRSGRDTIDHPAGQHDDLANVIAGAVAVAKAKKRDLRQFAIRPEGGAVKSTHAPVARWPLSAT